MSVIPPKDNPVRITIDNTMAHIRPVVPMVMQLLQHVDYRFGVEGGRIVPHRITSELCCERHGMLWTPAGCVPRIRQALTDAGYEVALDDRRQWDDHFRVQPVEAAETQALAQAVALNPLGQIEVPGHAGLVDMLCDLCRLYTHARVLIPTVTRKQAWRLWNAIRKQLGREVQFAYSGRWHVRGRIVVSTFANFDRDAADVVLLPQPLDVAGELAMESLMNLAGHKQLRVYALRPPGLRLSRRQELALEAFAGSIILRWGVPAVSVNVELADIYTRPAIDHSGTLARKRTACWANDPRNRQIAHIARSFRKGDMAAIWEAGLLLDETQRHLDAGGPVSVSVVVESVEHGRQMLSWLPGWTLRTLEMPGPGTGRRNHLVGEIVTVACAARDGIEAPVIIRADAGDSPLTLPRFPPPALYEDRKDVLVIDVADDFDPRAAIEVRRRVRQYLDRGYVVTASPRWLDDGERNQMTHAGRAGMGLIPATAVDQAVHRDGDR